MDKSAWGARLRDKPAVRTLGATGSKGSPSNPESDAPMEDASVVSGVERESSGSKGFRIPSGVSYVDTEDWNYGDVGDDEEEW